MTSEEARRVVGVILEGNTDCIRGAIYRLIVAFPSHGGVILDMWYTDLNERDFHLPQDYREGEMREMLQDLTEHGVVPKST